MSAHFIALLSITLALGASSALAKSGEENSTAFQRGAEDAQRGNNDNPYHTPGGEKYERWENGHDAAESGRISTPSFDPSPSTLDHSSWPSYDNRYDGAYSGSSSGSSPGGGSSPVSCSPKAVKTNIAQADKLMADLSSTEFKGNDTFKEVADDIAALKSGEFKVNEYFRLAGVKNPKDANEVLNFLYGRQVEAKNAKRVSELLAITPAQAERVIEKIKTTLRVR
jgi:hypothetical protein